MNPEIDYHQVCVDIMEEMLLFQYAESPILKSYIMAFITEVCILRTKINEVYLGRFLENAVGAQLDVIGRILGQTRNITIAVNGYFGFQGVVDVKGFGTTGDPTVGGIFKSGSEADFSIVPLTDVTYRKLLQGRAYATNRRDWSIETIYTLIDTVLGRNVKKWMVETGQNAELLLDITNISQEELDLLEAIRHWYVPMGTGLTITSHTF